MELLDLSCLIKSPTEYGPMTIQEYGDNMGIWLFESH